MPVPGTALTAGARRTPARQAIAKFPVLAIREILSWPKQLRHRRQFQKNLSYLLLLYRIRALQRT